MSKINQFFPEDVLNQARVATGLINALASSAQFAHSSKTQGSIENAIVALLDPLQPAKTDDGVNLHQSGEAGKPDPATNGVGPNPKEPLSCPDCGQVHDEIPPHVKALFEALELTGLVRVVGVKPKLH